MKKLYLVRHAHTVDNELKRYSGMSDTDLSEVGRKQSDQLCRYLSDNVVVDRVYTSTLKRTYETVRKYVEEKNIPVKRLSEMNEMDFGLFDSLTLEEIESRYEKEYSEFMKGDLLYRFPEGENIEDTYRRNIAGLKKIMDESKRDESIMIVGHMGTIRNIISHYLTGSYSINWNIKIENATITEIEFVDDFPVILFGYIPYDKSLLRPHKIKKVRKV